MSFMKRRERYQSDADFHFFVESLVGLLAKYELSCDEVSDILQFTEEVYAGMKGELMYTEPAKIKVWRDQ